MGHHTLREFHRFMSFLRHCSLPHSPILLFMKRKHPSAEDDWEELPTDTEIALTALRRSFSSQALPCIPLTALNGFTPGSLTLREELSQLAREGKAREVVLGDGEECALLFEDLDAYLQAEKGRSPPEDHPILSFYRFLSTSCVFAHVSEGDLADCFKDWLRLPSTRGMGGGGQPLSFFSQGLVSKGLLKRRQLGGGMAEPSYLFSAPHTGHFVASLKDGRAELLAKVCKAPGKQLERAYLLTLSLKKSSLPILLHLRDCLGRKLLTLCQVSGKTCVRAV